MILQKEIISIAESKKLPKTTIDKDWALGHFLDAIYSIPELKNILIFKGGTCIKKCYFPDYRFSEDLDFTSRDSKFVLTRAHLKSICDHVSKYAQIQTHIHSLIPLKFNDSLTGYEAIIKFWGADHPRNEAPPSPDRWQTKMKIEIILYELLIFSSEMKNISHTYSDKLSISEVIPCYSINEILAEKIRALIQRSYAAPRDFYDIWYLTTNNKDLDYKAIVDAFYRKLTFKKHVFTGIHQLLNSDNDKALKSAWKNSLAHQVPSDQLPEFEFVKNELQKLFEKIF
jgi:predicted nucleotidyltransferase component of viral defense system